MLSFAKIASAITSLPCNPFITVMKAADLWDLYDPPDARWLPKKWTLLVEPQMGSRLVVIWPAILRNYKNGGQLLDRVSGVVCATRGPGALCRMVNKVLRDTNCPGRL